VYRHRVRVQQINGGIYHELFNHPPLMLFLLGKFAPIPGALNIPFHSLFRLLSSLASFATFLLVYRLTRDRLQSKWNIFLYASCPTCILIAGFHGNTDPWMILFLVATAWSAESGKASWLTGLLFGIALNIKLVPVFLVPILFFYLRGKRERIICFTTIAIICLAIWLPYLWQDPANVLRSTFGYPSEFGIWGIGYLLKNTMFIWKYSFNAKYLVLALSILFAWCMNRSDNRAPLFDQFGITLFLFLFLSSGFAIQYMYWIAPWAVILGARTYMIHWAVSGMFAFTTYNWWSGGIPWWYADAVSVERFNTPAQVLCIAAWIAVGVVLFGYHLRYPAIVPLALQVLRNPRSSLA